MSKRIIRKNIIVGNPVCHPWYMFCKEQEEWKDIEGDVYYTEERYLPRIMVDIGLVPSISEIRRNKPELMITLNEPDFKEIKWGKSRLFIQIGE